MSLLSELKRRNVFKVAVAYIIVAWLTLQVSDTLAPALQLPGWFHSGVAFVLILGFPIALVLAWAFELTPDGLSRDTAANAEDSTDRAAGRTLGYGIIGLLAVALLYFVWESRFRNDADMQGESVAVLEAASEDSIPADAELSIAVLPFENRSSLEEDQFFTDGIHDDLLTTIAKIGSMKVISRTSVMQYRNTTKEIPQIAEELGVSSILEGGIQRSGNQVRINVQLIDASTDAHLWAEIYDRELNAENLFTIQSEISKAIADAMQATLSPEEVQRIDEAPTNNLPAFEAYLRGRQLMAMRDAESLETAVNHFNEAVTLDSQFALAWVGIADSNRLLGAYGGLPDEDFFAVREDAIQRALAINDKLGEAYTSLGALYADQEKLELAEAAYKQAIQLSPNYATAWQWYSALPASGRLQSERVIELLSKAAELDPLSPIIRLNLAGAYRDSGQYEVAEQQYLKMVDVNPGFGLGLRTLTYFYMRNLGRFDQATVYAQKAQELDAGQRANLFTMASIQLNLGEFSGAGTILDRLRELDINSRATVQLDIERNLLMHNFANARVAIDSLSSNFEGNTTGMMNMAFYMLAAGDIDRAKEIYAAATPDWFDADGIRRSRVRNVHGCAYSWILMNTGDTELGERLLQENTAAFDETLFAESEHIGLYKPEICYLSAGDKDRALRSIETQFDHKHLFDWKLYHLLPMYDLIRDEPRFKAVDQEFEQEIATQRQAVRRIEAEPGI